MSESTADVRAAKIISELLCLLFDIPADADSDEDPVTRGIEYVMQTCREHSMENPVTFRVFEEMKKRGIVT
jgi:hypothetical protein